MENVQSANETIEDLSMKLEIHYWIFNPLCLSCTLLVFICFFSFKITAQDLWTGNIDSNWENAANWSTNPSLPANGNAIIIDSANNYTGVKAHPVISINSSFSPGTVDVLGGGKLTIQAGLTAQNMVTVDNNYTAFSTEIDQSNGVLTIQNDFGVEIWGGAVYNLTGGTMNIEKDLKIDESTFNMDESSGNSSAVTINTDNNTSGKLTVKCRGNRSGLFNMDAGTFIINQGEDPREIELDGGGDLGAFNATIDISGGIFTNNGATAFGQNDGDSTLFQVTGGTVTLVGDVDDAGGSGKIGFNVTGGGLTFQGDILMDESGDIFTQSGTGTVTFQNTKNWTNAGTFNSTGDTVIFDGNTSLLDATGEWQFNHLTINNAKTMSQPGPANINVSGSWTNSGGIFSESTNNVTFNGSGLQTLTHAAPSDSLFYNFAVNKSAGNISLSGNVVVQNTLAMTQGNIVCNSDTLTLGISTGTIGALSYTSGTIVGNFKRWIDAAGTWLFPVGTQTYYRPDSTIINTLDNNGSLIVEFIAADPDTLGLSVLAESGLTFPDTHIEGYWISTAANSMVSTNFDLRLTGNGFSTYVDPYTRIVKRVDETNPWTLNGIHVNASPASSTAKRSGVTGVTGQFALAKTDCDPPAVNPISGQDTVCKNTTEVYSVTDNGNSYTWTVTGGTIATGAGTDSITVDWGAVSGSANVSVKEEVACGNFRITDFPIYIKSVSTSVITGNSSLYPGTTGEIYSVINTPGYSYTWTITGGSQISGGTSDTITVDWGNGSSGQVAVIGYDGNCPADTVTLSVSLDGYSSSTVTQSNVTTVSQYTFDAQMIGIEIVKIGNSSDTIKQFNFDTDGGSGDGTGDPFNNLSGAKVYYTDTSNIFSTITLFGSVATPNGKFSITGSVVINAAGTYYFWLTYDVPFNANTSDTLDAQLDSLKFSSSWKSDMAVNAPAGYREIAGATFYHSIGGGGNWNSNGTWSNTDGGPNCNCVPIGSGKVFIDTNDIVTLDVNLKGGAIEDLLIQDGALLNWAFGELHTTQTLKVVGTGRFNLGNKLVVGGNATFSGTGSSTSSQKMTFSSSLDVGSGTSLSETGNQDINIKGNLTVDGTISHNGAGSKKIKMDGAGASNISGTGNITATDANTIFEIKNADRSVLSGTDLTIQVKTILTGNITITNNGTITFLFDLSGAMGTPTWANATGSILNYAGSNGLLAGGAILIASANGNTVNYNRNGNQNIIQPAGNQYWHLISDSGGTKVLLGDIDIDGDNTIINGVTLEAANNSILLAGNWNNQNTVPSAGFTEGTGLVTFNGGNAQLITHGGGIETFNSLTVNKSGNNVTFGAGVDVFIIDTLTLASGNIITASNLITVSATGTLSGGSASSYVRGKMKHIVNVNTPVTKVYPIACGLHYRKVELIIDQDAATATEYTAEVIFSSAEALGYTKPGTIDTVSGIRYWEINQEATGVGMDSAKAKLYWGSDDGVIDLPNLTVVKDDGTGNWIDLDGTATGNSSSGNILSGIFNTFSKFAFANKSGGGNPLPIELLYFDAELDEGEDLVNLKWATASEINNDFFVIERSVDGIDFNNVTYVTGAGNSNKIMYYSAIDPEPLLGISYYRLKQIDYDSSIQYSPMVSVYYVENRKLGIVVRPNPAEGDFYVDVHGEKDTEVLVVLFDVMGKVHYSKVIILESNGHTLAIDPSNKLGPGVYLIIASSLPAETGAKTGNNRLYQKKLIIR